MSNRYWVLGTGDWSDTDHWATESSGDGGADVPTSSDDVFIDSNSGFGSGGTITLDTYDCTCNDFTSSSGHNYAIGGTTLKIYGSFTAEAGMDFSGLGDSLYFEPSVSETLTSAGADLLAICIGALGATGTLTLQDDLLLTFSIIVYGGAFDANDHNVTASSFLAAKIGATTPVVNMGSGLWTITGGSDAKDENIWLIVDSTLNAETSTLKFTDADFYYKILSSEGYTYNNVWLSGTGSFYIMGSNTYNNPKTDAGLKVFFLEESTTTVNTFTAIGSSGNLITVNSCTALYESSSTQHTLSCTSGVISCDYLDISNSNATGGATWYAGSHSIDSGNNDGWIFEDPIIDTTPPVITLLGTASVAVRKDSIYTDAGATALDETDGDITENIVTVNPVDTASTGLYTITYNVQDGAGNNATEVIRTVNVFEVSKSVRRIPYRSKSRMRK